MSENINQINTLFGVLGYESNDEYETFINRLLDGNKSDIIITLQSAIRYSLSKGIYTLEESEALSITLRKITQILTHLNGDSPT